MSDLSCTLGMAHTKFITTPGCPSPDSLTVQNHSLEHHSYHGYILRLLHILSHLLDISSSPDIHYDFPLSISQRMYQFNSRSTHRTLITDIGFWSIHIPMESTTHNYCNISRVSLYPHRHGVQIRLKFWWNRAFRGVKYLIKQRYFTGRF